MKAYFAAKSEKQLKRIQKLKEISLGRNVATDEPLAHVSLTPFKKGSFALDVIGDDTNEAWVLTLEIPDDTEVEDDPSGEGETYGGEWKVSKRPIPIEKIVSIEHIENVTMWELGEKNFEKIFGAESEEEPRKRKGKRLGEKMR